jgi:dTDP-4-dehydrorhamnose reductase
MRILLLGKNGQIGFELERTLAPLGDVLPFDQDVADFLNPSTVRNLIRDQAPDVIVNAAAYTAVDKAESDNSLCHAINAAGPALLAEEAQKRNALLVHYSTDYVYPGNKTSPYLEDDATGPLGEYGRSKLEGDRAIEHSGANYLIFRTAWVYGARGQNFLRTMLRLGNERPELRVVSDQVGAPTWSRMIAQGTAHAIARAIQKPADYSGVYHLTAAGQTSWYEFTAAIFDQFVPDRRPKLMPITTDQYPTPAKRPAYSVLSNDKFARVFGARLPDWRRQLAMVAANMASQNAPAAVSAAK